MNKRIRPTEFTITTNSAKLKEVSMAGKGKFNVKDKLVSTDKVRMDIAGKGIINMNDSVLIDKLEFNMAGSSTVNAFALNIRQLEGNIAGIGNIHYKGSPSVQVDKAGIGNVKKMN